MKWTKFDCLSQAPWRNDLLLLMDGKVYTYSPVYFPPLVHPEEFCVVSMICSSMNKIECCENFAVGDMHKFRDKYWMSIPPLDEEVR